MKKIEITFCPKCHQKIDIEVEYSRTVNLSLDKQISCGICHGDLSTHFITQQSKILRKLERLEELEISKWRKKKQDILDFELNPNTSSASSKKEVRWIGSSSI